MKKGFTLFEILVVLLLFGVIAVASTISLIPAIEALNITRENVNTAQKTQFAIARIVREFTTITNVVIGSPNLITYDFLDPSGTGIRHTMRWSGVPGDSLLLENQPLMDQVASMQLRYYSSPNATEQSFWNANTTIIEIRLQSLNTPDVFTNRIAPRNI